jgi:hypothetical protein
LVNYPTSIGWRDPGTGPILKRPTSDVSACLPLGFTALILCPQGKIECRTRRPWFDLQRSYYYRDQTGVIKNSHELKIALEHFHVLLSSQELEQLFDNFPGRNGSFDFHAFAERMYPRERAPGRIYEGRPVDEQQQQQQQQKQAQQQQQPQSQTNGQLPFVNYGQQQAQHQPQQQQQQFSRSAELDSEYAPTQIYERVDSNSSYGNGQTYSNGYGASSNDYSASSNGYDASPNQYGSSTGSIPISRDDRAAPVLGSTYNSNGTTAYWRESTGAQQAHPMGLQARGTTRKPFKPRLTYNRQHQQRFNTAPFELSYPRPKLTPYPASYSLGPNTKPRFDQKPPVVLVDVPRRHNISRSYNRDGTETQQQGGRRR